MQGSKKTTAIRTFEIVADVSGMLEGDINDWPANIQDVVFAALERKAQAEQLPLIIVASRCAEDPDVPAGTDGHFYLHIIASEVVMADQRTVSRERIMAELPDDIKKLLN